MMIRSISIKQWLSLIVVGAFFLSLGYSFYHRIEPAVDARAYDTIALNILAGDGFREDVKKPMLYDPGILRAGPGYEYFLAALYKIFGHSYEIVWIVQALLHALTALLLFFVAKRLFSERGELIGLIAAAAIAIHPDLIEISAMLMTETLYLFLEMLLLFLFAKVFTGEKNYRIAIFLGTVAGLSVLTRPPLLLFFAIILFFFLLKRRFSELVLVVAVFVLVMTPWTIRNYHVYKQFIPTTLISEYNLWVGNTMQSSGGQMSEGLNPATAFGEANGYGRFGEVSRSAFKTFLMDHPLQFAKLTALRVVRYGSLIRPMGFWFYQVGIGQLIFVALSLLAIAVLFILGLAGLLFLLRKKHKFAPYLIAFASVSVLALLPAVVESRYRFQIYPILVLAGAAFFVWRKSEFSDMRSSLYNSLIALVVISLVDILIFAPAVMSHIDVLF